MSMYADTDEKSPNVCPKLYCFWWFLRTWRTALWINKDEKPGRLRLWKASAIPSLPLPPNPPYFYDRWKWITRVKLQQFSGEKTQRERGARCVLKSNFFKATNAKSGLYMCQQNFFHQSFSEYKTKNNR